MTKKKASMSQVLADIKPYITKKFMAAPCIKEQDIQAICQILLPRYKNVQLMQGLTNNKPDFRIQVKGLFGTEEKRFEVYCAVGSIYRPEINLNRSVYASMDWINTTHLEMYVKAKRNGIPVYENEQPGVDYIIKKGDEASLREQIAFAMTGIEHYIIPAFDKVVDLKTCVDYLELYGFDELEISRKTECNGDVFILPAKYPDVESYSAKVQNDLQEAKRRVMQRVSEKKMTEKEGKERLLRCEGRYNDDIKQYEKFFSDEITKNEIARLKAERAEKNLNAIRTMGIEV